MSRDIRFQSVDANPYEPPSAPLEAKKTESQRYDLRLFLDWEKLRLLYNAILGVETLLLLMVMPPARGKIIAVGAQLVMACLAANLCYCLGPVLNGYSELIGFRGRAVTIVIFSLGMIVAMFLALLSSISWSGGFGPG
jgi:hypothetical protein